MDGRDESGRESGEMVQSDGNSLYVDTPRGARHAIERAEANDRKPQDLRCPTRL